MAVTPSSMLPLGTRAPDFNLQDTVTGNKVTLGESKSSIATLIMFICNHCPYVIHIREELLNVIHEYQTRGISFIAISSNDIRKYPEDATDKMKEYALKYNFDFPYLFDETQEIAKAYQAECTPDFFLFDKNLQLVYRGRFDASTPGNNKPITGKDLKNAMDCLLDENEVPADQYPSMGCNIKWK
ncbi:MAG TPA: thioredoxin family protein [Cyclobacteriaceae bacterium]